MKGGAGLTTPAHSTYHINRIFIDLPHSTHILLICQRL